ncbi:hypothetical protein GUITHDRAFT_107502 [Guillardia theta CCMP2712]|uniref:Uncharacterized protein n=1 Tax=Guillardia theta (strain CCMP2712) TaxID=905079 RepID=L1JF53_GUITC|nr:hypothetical protein GUITHDRAFT_107502 [Guillardia theta CCMP2712]EKX46725.1 hypothetical protein GUITHDRAFT_107502 [Guillardia theta CCMP2712]|eukprot:XP_005833705.1 hypothetical protein GUITHDRAFT_107502 [Guillardia theta CCMP2712]
MASRICIEGFSVTSDVRKAVPRLRLNPGQEQYLEAIKDRMSVQSDSKADRLDKDSCLSNILEAKRKFSNSVARAQMDIDGL